MTALHPDQPVSHRPLSHQPLAATILRALDDLERQPTPEHVSTYENLQQLLVAGLTNPASSPAE